MRQTTTSVSVWPEPANPTATQPPDGNPACFFYQAEWTLRQTASIPPYLRSLAYSAFFSPNCSTKGAKVAFWSARKRRNSIEFL